MNLNLNDKVIVVTGAGKGIGYSIAEQLLESGAVVAAHYNTSKDNLLALSNEFSRLKMFQADLSRELDCMSLLDRVENDFGKIDVLINNAGVAVSTDPGGSDEEFCQSWDQTMAVNLKAVGILCKKAVEKFIPNNGGIIINISSRAAFRGDTSQYLAYAASKGGVVALTRSIARAYGKQGIVAYNVAPGFTRTEMAEQFIEEYGEEYALNDIALDELTSPEDIAPTVTFLASGMAKHATGSTIDINAGSYVH